MEKVEALVRDVVKGLQPYKPGKPIGEVQRELGLEYIVKMASNENPLGPSPKAVEAMKTALGEVNYYPENSVFYLRKALAEKFGLPEDCFIFGNGSSEVIHIVCHAFLDHGQISIMAEPSFIVYKLATLICGGVLKSVPLKNWVHDLDAMLDAIDDHTKIIFICNPNNPTGTIVGKDDVEQFMERVPEDIVVVFDEAYYEYAVDDDYPDTIKYVREERNVVVLRSFSKIYGLAGLRVGYGVAKPEIVEYLNRVRPPFNVNTLAQTAALAALDDAEHLQRSRQVNEEGKFFLEKELDKLGVEYVPTRANFIFLDFKRDAGPICKALLKEGVIIRPMTAFGLSPNFARVTIGTQEQNEYFIEALARVLKNCGRGDEK